MTKPSTHRLLDILLDRAAHNAPCPSNDEICRLFGYSSWSSAARLIGKLEATGAIRVERSHSARTVTIVSTGEQLATDHTFGPANLGATPGKDGVAHGAQGEDIRWRQAAKAGSDALLAALRGYFAKREAQALRSPL